MKNGGVVCISKSFRVYSMYVCVFQQSMDQPGTVANPCRGQLNREEMNFPLSPFAPDNLVSRDGFGRLVSREPAHCPHPGWVIWCIFTGFLSACHLVYIVNRHSGQSRVQSCNAFSYR